MKPTPGSLWYYTASGSTVLIVVAVDHAKNYAGDYICTVLVSENQLFKSIVFPLKGWLQA